MKKGILLGLLLAAMFLSTNAYAAKGDNVWQMAQSEKYGTKLGGMLGRGVINVATCFVDLIVQTVDGTQDGPPFVGTLTGLGGGLGCTALRVSSGALDVITSWVPDFNGIPVARSYHNCLEYEEETPSPVQEVVTQPVPAQVVAAPVVAQPVQQAAPQHDPYEYVKK